MPHRLPLCEQNAGLLTVLRELSHEYSDSLNTSRVLSRAVRSLEHYRTRVTSREEFLLVPNVGEWIATKVQIRIQNCWAVQAITGADGSCPDQPRDPEENLQPRQEATSSVPNRQQVPSGASVLEQSDEEASPPANNPIPSHARGRGRSRRRSLTHAANLSAGLSAGGRRPYRPRYRSAPYAILIALYKATLEGCHQMRKRDIAELAQPYADDRILAPASEDRRTWYNGWSSVNSQLVQRRLIKTWSNPKWYALTEEGLTMAKDLFEMQISAVERTVEEYVRAGDVASGRDGQAQAEPRSSTSGDCTGAAERLDGHIQGACEFGQLGSSGAGKQNGRFEKEQVGNRKASHRGGMRFTKQVNRAIDVVERLERDGEERELCLQILGELFEKEQFPKTTEKLYEKLTEALWKKKWKETARGEDVRKIQIRPFENGATGNRGAAGGYDLNERRKITALSCEMNDRAPSKIYFDPGVTTAPAPTGVENISVDVRNGLNVAGVRPTTSPLQGAGYSNGSEGVNYAGSSNESPRNRSAQESYDSLSQKKPCPEGAIPVISLEEDSDAGSNDPQLSDPSTSRRAEQQPKTQRSPHASDDNWSTGIENMSMGNDMGTPQPLVQDEVVYVCDEDTPRANVKARVDGVSSSIIDEAVGSISPSGRGPYNKTPQGLMTSDSTLWRQEHEEHSHCYPSMPGELKNASSATRKDKQALTTPSAHEAAPELDATVSRDPGSQGSGVGVPECRVVLVVDSMERVRKRSRDILDTIKGQLLAQGVDCEVRQLPCGDAMFVAQYPGGIEVILDYIIERKTLEDFHASMRDGRERRQAFMMRQAQIPRRIFLLEGDVKRSALLRNNASFEKRRAEIEVCDDFYVKKTKSLDDTLWFYSSMYKRLCMQFSERPLALAMEGRNLYQNWNERMRGLTRGISLGQLFMLQLCQVKHVGKDTAVGIVKSGCKTPIALYERFRSVQNEADRENVFAGEVGINKKAVRTLAKLFTASEYEVEAAL
ncbi:to fill in [Chondrus crispus]|uniref:Crossover junction endonuclease MUS81 n=1 Tax=Chondrus crispus TaxID=2769 RepID=R7QEB5_CHOCR|nr:to fill in [Chondrus crispus]CDF36414.1 to fill in [Chondrus crispus]|eukprot:XP_005716233.1 to fill in [Chondrus crispus]